MILNYLFKMPHIREPHKGRVRRRQKLYRSQQVGVESDYRELYFSLDESDRRRFPHPEKNLSKKHLRKLRNYTERSS